MDSEKTAFKNENALLQAENDVLQAENDVLQAEKDLLEAKLDYQKTLTQSYYLLLGAEKRLTQDLRGLINDC